jgi:protein-tyrosine phosphatase
MRVLVVCTGNICRSPLAEGLLRARLAAAAGAAAKRVHVSSAGTAALAGWPMEAYAEDALAALGAEPGAHSARAVDRALVESADLVLTAERAHRSAVVSLVPAAAARTHTLLAFDRLAAAVDLDAVVTAAGPGPAERGRALVAAAARQRGRVPPGPEDIADPFRGTARDFAVCADLIDRSLGSTVALLAAAAARPSSGR